ncbi:MAG: ribosomal-processing cysteine protease Prp [Lachnospiraceae bacterium]|nr:ribosomal-processing cysteine protease Prp [Lachnospiraceae bacterium]
MTTITICKTAAGTYAGFHAFGHAEYVKRGKPDILCSAISALVVNTINCMEELYGEKMKVATNEETGFIKCDFEGSLQKESIVLMDSMVFGLENLSKTYGKKFLQVKFEEV